MYYSIEKFYKKNNPNKEFNIFYWSVSISLAIIFVILTMFGVNTWVAIIAFFVILLLLIVVYTIVDYKNKLKNVEITNGLKNKIEAYRDSIQNQNIENLIYILQKNDITKKNQIKQCILYYNKKVPVTIKSGFLGNFTTMLIGLASFVVAGYDDELGDINYQKLITAFGSSIGIIFIIWPLVFGIKEFIDAFVFPKDKLYSELEDNLMYIYINHDKFFN